MNIDTSFHIGEFVSHVAQPGAQGLVVGFMMRGRNHSYEIQWSTDKCCWHFDFEIVRKPENLPQIGFAPDAGGVTCDKR